MLFSKYTLIYAFDEKKALESLFLFLGLAILVFVDFLYKNNLNNVCHNSMTPKFNFNLLFQFIIYYVNFAINDK